LTRDMLASLGVWKRLYHADDANGEIDEAIL
jgi:hypothetical protein